MRKIEVTEKTILELRDRMNDRRAYQEREELHVAEEKAGAINRQLHGTTGESWELMDDAINELSYEASSNGFINGFKLALEITNARSCSGIGNDEELRRSYLAAMVEQLNGEKLDALEKCIAALLEK